VIELAQCFGQSHAQVDIFDPWVDAGVARQEYDVDLLERMPAEGQYDAIVLAVAHEQFRALGAEGVRRFGRGNALLYYI